MTVTESPLSRRRQGRPCMLAGAPSSAPPSLEPSTRQPWFTLRLTARPSSAPPTLLWQPPDPSNYSNLPPAAAPISYLQIPAAPKPNVVRSANSPGRPRSCRIVSPKLLTIVPGKLHRRVKLKELLPYGPWHPGGSSPCWPYCQLRIMIWNMRATNGLRRR